jgi:hypothetical protein
MMPLNRVTLEKGKDSNAIIREISDKNKTSIDLELQRLEKHGFFDQAREMHGPSVQL